MASPRFKTRLRVSRLSVTLGRGNSALANRTGEEILVVERVDDYFAPYALPHYEVFQPIEVAFESLGQTERLVEEAAVAEWVTDRQSFVEACAEMLALLEERTDVLLISGVETVSDALAPTETITSVLNFVAGLVETLAFGEAPTDRSGFSDVKAEPLGVLEIGTARHSGIEIKTEALSLQERAQVWSGHLEGYVLIESVSDFFTPSGYVPNAWVDNLSEQIPLSTDAGAIEYVAEPVGLSESRADALGTVYALAEVLTLTEAGGESRHTVDDLAEIIPLATSMGSAIENLTEYIPLGS